VGPRKRFGSGCGIRLKGAILKLPVQEVNDNPRKKKISARIEGWFRMKNFLCHKRMSNVTCPYATLVALVG
jgi:hypothetical protein